MDPFVLVSIAVVVLALSIVTASVLALYRTREQARREDARLERESRLRDHASQVNPLWQDRPEPIQAEPVEAEPVESEPEPVEPEPGAPEEHKLFELSRYAALAGSVVLALGIAAFVFLFAAEIYAAAVGLVTTLVRLALVAIFAAAMDWRTGYNTIDEIRQGNAAVGLYVAGLLIAAGIVVSV